MKEGLRGGWISLELFRLAEDHDHDHVHEHDDKRKVTNPQLERPDRLKVVGRSSAALQDEDALEELGREGSREGVVEYETVTRLGRRDRSGVTVSRKPIPGLEHVRWLTFQAVLQFPLTIHPTVGHVQTGRMWNPSG